MYEKQQRQIRKHLIDFKTKLGYEGNLEPSWAYDLKINYANNDQYPNAGYPGVYIFVTENEFLNVGKSFNAVGGELHRDVKGWVLKWIEEKKIDVAVITVYMPDVTYKNITDMPRELEKYLINSLELVAQT
jgi:hypothetical protein